MTGLKADMTGLKSLLSPRSSTGTCWHFLWRHLEAIWATLLLPRSTRQIVDSKALLNRVNMHEEQGPEQA
jgi:hypothetical protein